MFSITQTVLSQLLAINNTTPERLSTHEAAIAQRICHCALCNNLWIHRVTKIPDRCPACHQRAWDRPLLTAMILADKTTSTRHPSQVPIPDPPTSAQKNKEPKQ